MNKMNNELDISTAERGNERAVLGRLCQVNRAAQAAHSNSNLAPNIAESDHLPISSTAAGGAKAHREMSYVGRIKRSVSAIFGLHPVYRVADDGAKKRALATLVFHRKLRTILRLVRGLCGS